MDSSPPIRSMKQSTLSFFKPRVSSGLASASTLASPPQAASSPSPGTPGTAKTQSSKIPVHGSADDSDDEVQTPPLDDTFETDLTTPPPKVDQDSTLAAASGSRGPVASSSALNKHSLDGDGRSNDDDGDGDDDDDDDDLSDPPPLSTSPLKGKHKVLTKKRPSNASTKSVNDTPPAKKSKTISGPNSASPNASGGVRKLAPPGEGLLCHEHRADCPSEKLRCTFMRTPSTRCGLKFCAAGLKSMHNQDVDAIKERGRVVSNEADDGHCPASEAPYIFKCPRCDGTCMCSLCRKKWGLPPRSHVADGSSKSSSSSTAPKSKATSAESSSAKPKGQNSKSGGTKKVKTGQKGKKKDEKSGKKAKEPKSKGKAAAGSNKQNSIKNALTGKAKSLSGAKIPKQTSLPRALKPPVPVPAPELEVIQTALSPQNVWARIWIYETLVRFDFIKVPKATLLTLDKFDLWSHRQVQILLERILVALAGMSSINSGQPRARWAPAIKAYRAFNEDLKRGEPWKLARDAVEASGYTVTPLPHVARVFADESKEHASTPEADSGPTLLGSRLTRTRRAAEVKALERVKAQSMVDYEREFSSDDFSDSEDDRRFATYSRGSEDQSADGSEEDEDAGPRRPGRTSARRTESKWQAVAAEGTRRSGRQRAPPQATEAPRIISSTRVLPRGQLSVRTASAQSSASPLSSPERDLQNDPIKADRATDDSPPPLAVAPVEAEPVSAPEMEEKVATLCSLLEVVLNTSEVAEELKAGSVRLADIDKAAKEDLKLLEKEWEDAKKETNGTVPSMMQTEEFAKWKKDKEKRERDYRLRVLDVKINAHREAEANKLRTGPLGVDADGRTFWQLTEFNETMPRDTMGRWAWCLVVFGQNLTKHAAPAEAMPKNMPNISPIKRGVSDIVDGEEVAAAAATDAKPEQAETIASVHSHSPAKNVKSEGSVASPLTPVNKTSSPSPEGASDIRAKSSDLSSVSEAEQESEPVFMGTNYPPSFKEVIAFLRYRCAQKDYEELKEQHDAEIATKLKGESSSDGDKVAPNSPAASSTGAVGRKAKRQLKDAQDARRARVEELCKRLDALRGYYLWHAGEPDDSIEV